MKYYLYIFSLLELLTFIPLKISAEKVIYAWQMHRHGARAPYLGVTNFLDFYKEKWIAKEELTNIGKRMLYLLGVKARKRYVDETKLLSPEYSPQEILIRSTDVNRTIESVECFIQGLYPHGTGPVLNEAIAKNESISYPPNIKYKDKFAEIINQYDLNKEGNFFALPYRMSILPIHLFYNPAHEFGLYSTSQCKGHLEINLAQKTRKEIFEFGENLTTRFPGIIEYLQGTNNKTINYEYWNLFKYADTYVIDKRDQRKFEILTNNPSNNFTDDDFIEYEKYSKQFLFMDYSETNYPKAHPEIATMSMSYTMHSIVNWMENAKKGDKENSSYIKYVVYSAHDSSIGALEYFMENTFNDVTAEYAELAESRFFELYIDDNNNYKVRYLKGNSDTAKLDISFDEFKQIINNKTWSDEKVAEYCKFNEKDTPTDNPSDSDKTPEKDSIATASFIAMIIMIVIVVILAIILIVIIIKNKKRIN